MANLSLNNEAKSKAREKFLRFFPNGFNDEKYISWERGYKWQAHLLWKSLLNKDQFSYLLMHKKYEEIAKLALSIEGKTNLLFSFEKMAIRDALKTPEACKQFAEGVFNFLHGKEKKSERFIQYTQIIAALPRKQTRVLTWPLVTVFGFIAEPKHFIFLKPNVTKIAAANYGYNFEYQSQPNWKTYKNLVNFAGQIKSDLIDLKPKDYIDLQSFIWTLGSQEYE
ncbi:MAG: hypothetical protein H0U57_12955 [Tatlockia sp.]|nr:hypothetical protein [Tatlockia sp.]